MDTSQIDWIKGEFLECVEEKVAKKSGSRRPQKELKFEEMRIMALKYSQKVVCAIFDACEDKDSDGQSQTLYFIGDLLRSLPLMAGLVYNKARKCDRILEDKEAYRAALTSELHRVIDMIGCCDLQGEDIQSAMEAFRSFEPGVDDGERRQEGADNG